MRPTSVALSRNDCIESMSAACAACSTAIASAPRSLCRIPPTISRVDCVRCEPTCVNADFAVDAAEEALFGRRAECELFEEPREALGKVRLFFSRFGQRQLERVAQQRRVGQPDAVDDRQRIERFRRRNAEFRAAQRCNESSEGDVHGGAL